MHIIEYLQILYKMKEIINQTMVFDFDNILDGTYNFNIKEGTIIYDLLQIIEVIASANEFIVCQTQENTKQKDFMFQFNSTIYNVCRLQGVDESIIITKASSGNIICFVTESELFKHIDNKYLSKQIIPD